ncbi:MAG TPA: glycosyltransferase family 39 protein [Candidatus Binataceae bacterium]
MRSADDLVAAGVGFVTSAVLFALTLDTPFVKDPEATYAIDTRSVMRGDWLLVHALGRKPPLYVWIGAAISAFHGSVTEVTSRMPGVIAGGALCALLFAFVARRLDRPTALWSWLILLSMPGFITNCVTAQVDPMLVLWTFAALLAFYPIAAEEEHGLPLVVAAGVALGLGILSKGPIAVVIVGGTIAIWLLLMGKSPTHFLRRSALAGAVALLIATSWYVAAMIQGGREFARILYEENFGHFLPGVAGGTGEAGRPIYYIAAHLIGASFPIVILLPAAAIATWSEFEPDRRSLLSYFGSLALTVTLFFSLASSKREVYVMSALPALALLIGAYIAESIAGRAARASRVAFRIAVAAFLVALGALGVGSISIESSVALISKIGLHSTDRMLMGLIANAAASGNLWLRAAAIATALAAAVILIGIWRDRTSYQSAGVVAAAVVLTMVWAGAIRPLFARMRTEKYFLERVREALQSSDLHLIALGEPDIEADYYLDRDLPVVQPRDLPAILGPVYLLTRTDALALIPGLKVVMSGAQESGRGGLALAKFNSLEP